MLLRARFLVGRRRHLAVSPHDRRDEGALWGLRDEGADPIYGGSALPASSPPEDTVTPGLRFRHANLGWGTNIRPIATFFPQVWEKVRSFCNGEVNH